MKCKWGLGWALGVCVAITLGCGSSTPDGGVVADSSLEDAAPLELPWGVTPSPDGMGYCCPAGSSGCECDSYAGGFVLAPASCGPAYCDSPPPLWESHRDEHGCEYLESRPPRSDDDVCHLGYQPDGGSDGGLDASLDGGADVGLDAGFDAAGR